jgi:type II secretory pathway pseudopilin PulG
MQTNQDARQGGFTIAELVIVAALLGLLVYALSTLASQGGDAQLYANRLNRATELTQDIIDQVRGELVSSVRLFSDDEEGDANLALLDLVGQPVPLTGSRLPTIHSDVSLRADTVGNEITGNSLFFARLAWTDRFECRSGAEYLVDVYRWNYYYLTIEDAGPTPGSPIGLNLVRFESEPLVSAASIDRIADTGDRADVLEHLRSGSPDVTGVSHSPCFVVWRRGALPSIAGTLQGITSTGGLSTLPTDGRGGWSIQSSEGVLRGLLSYRYHSVVTNYAPVNQGVGKYALRSAVGGGFPHGLEVQIVGPSNGRQTMLHLVVASTNNRGQRAWSDAQVVIDSRDL